MTSLSTFPPGADIVVEERLRETLWSAVPNRVISSDPSLLISWVPLGARAVYATNRGMPETAGLTRGERKLLACKTGRAVAREFAEPRTRLCVYRPDRWAAVYLGWDSDGKFLGWYVDFQLPVQSTATGLVTRDLVLDIWINADHSWHWKDRDDFDSAITQGIVDADIRTTLVEEAESILTELHARSCPFDADLPQFAPDTSWQAPVLADEYRLGGSAWTLPLDPQRVV